MSDAIERAAVREQIAQALHGDQCPDDPDPGESCMCGSGDFHRQADIALDVLREAGLLAPAPLREVSKYLRTADEFCKGEQGTRTHRCWVTAWVPVDAVDRAEGDGRAER